MIQQNKRLIRILLSLELLLLIPLIAMQFTTEVNWNLLDFLVMGLLLMGVALGIEFSLRKAKSGNSKLAFIISIVILFLLIWAELGVGIFGTPLAGS